MPLDDCFRNCFSIFLINEYNNKRLPTKAHMYKPLNQKANLYTTLSYKGKYPRTGHPAWLHILTKNSSSKQSEINSAQEEAGGEMQRLLCTVLAENSAFFLLLSGSQHRIIPCLHFLVLLHSLTTATSDSPQPLVKGRRTLTAGSGYRVPGTGPRVPARNAEKAELQTLSDADSIEDVAEPNQQAIDQRSSWISRC